ncbi:unnamed protein product [Cuscuta campestris]|uniref:Retrotransposon gag domain-containing protein n=1 Tax=Cuscuta campestris TaxID=132261 RepID=A0A484LMN4_9ASTE|nr:unnamed protein product [Cuscuta campestris]
MSHTSQNITKEDLVASNAELKAQVEYLAKQVAQLTKMKLKMTVTPEESEDEQEEESHAETPSSSIRKDNQEKSSTGFKVEIPTFDGRDEPDDFIEWLETVERVFDYAEVPEDKKVKLVALKFRGYASTWWTNTTTKRKRKDKAAVKTWTKMRALLKKKFIPTHYIRENFARLQHLRQGNQSVEEYNREFEELLMRCDLQENDSQTFVRYLFGLNTQIANTVELQTFESLEELTKLALKLRHLRAWPGNVDVGGDDEVHDEEGVWQAPLGGDGGAIRPVDGGAVHDGVNRLQVLVEERGVAAVPGVKNPGDEVEKEALVRWGRVDRRRAAVADQVGDPKLANDDRHVVEDPIVATVRRDVVTADGQPCDPCKCRQVNLYVVEIDAAVDGVPITAQI